MVLQERMYRCILYGAYGDAFGSDIEMMTLEEIYQQYGKHGKQKLNPADAITDDTQMTLFTLEGLALSQGKSMDERVQIVYESYLRWFNTQYGPGAIDEKIAHVGELWKFDELYDMRAPGHACIDSLRSGNMGTLDKQFNNSLGNGTVMRSAPFGFLINEPPEYVFELAMRCAAITHGHRDGQHSAGIFALIIYYMLKEDAPIVEAINNTMYFFEKYLQANSLNPALSSPREYIKTAFYCLRALAIPEQNKSFHTFYNLYNNTWIADQALGIGVYFAVCYGDKAISYAANIDGDSDTVAAIVGNLIGARPTPMQDSAPIKLLNPYADIIYDYISSISPK